MIFGYPVTFPEDACERLVADAATARRLVAERCPQLLDLLEHRRRRFAPLLAQNPEAPVTQAEDAILLAFCRLAYRHGSWGKDFHHYHNEGHIFEILGSRLERLIDTIGLETLSLRDWFLLTLFAAAHDLRQREVPEFAAGIGANERASIEETFRILRACGFTQARNADVFLGIELMIAGSTIRRAPAAESNGIQQRRWWCNPAVRWPCDWIPSSTSTRTGADPQYRACAGPATIAAGPRHGHVAEPFPLFMASAERLCLEREMRSYCDPGRIRATDARLFTSGQRALLFRPAPLQFRVRPRDFRCR